MSAPSGSVRRWLGQPAPLGASYDGSGTNFAIFSSSADRVDLCLFDEHRNETRIELTEVDGHIWHVYLPDVRPGQRYGYRVHGEWNPGAGLWSNPNKLLIDPYATVIEGQMDWSSACFAFNEEDHDQPDSQDSAHHVPLCMVSDPYFDWGDDRRPHTPLHKTVIYETHVRGLTLQHPEIPPELRGTYAGLAHPCMIRHLQQLGITAVELMPVHQFVHDHHLHLQGLRNYWGYNTIGYLAPHNEYSHTRALHTPQEFKSMVKALHSAGIEVILDVVYNHTAEGSHLGPTLSLRGIDNLAYYRTMDHNPREYEDFTGCGNSLNARHPHVLQLIMDSLRYWVTEMRVDGFRFDLASTLARELYEVDRLSTFFQLIQQDPVISRVKLIAEPWDLGEGGYQVGRFPPQWSEWNAHYRDTLRDFWRGEPSRLAEFASRFTGSSDLYAADTRRPTASINFVTAHDGFTLVDLVSYNDRHNLANGEDGRDGESHNRSWNHGAEGPTSDPEIQELRNRQRRNMMATLLLSQGVPMILGGDELGRTQQGNNNPYCQDNEISWYDWETVDTHFLEWVSRLIALRTEHPVFRRRRWFQGRRIHNVEDMAWLRPDGQEMSESDWEQGFAKALGVFINGEQIHVTDTQGQPVRDETFLLLCNAADHPVEWQLPPERWGEEWTTVLDSARTELGTSGHPREEHAADDLIEVPERSLILLLRTKPQLDPLGAHNFETHGRSPGSGVSRHSDG
jgi:glycogen operon protein